MLKYWWIYSSPDEYSPTHWIFHTLPLINGPHTRTPQTYAYFTTSLLYEYLTPCPSPELSLGNEATIHQVTTLLATSEKVLFPGHNHLLTTSGYDRHFDYCPSAGKGGN